MSVSWNPWHGCHKISPGCAHCYVYRTDLAHDKDPTQVKKTGSFSLPVARSRDGRYKVPPGELVYTCFTSDFLLEEADSWRPQAWEMMAQRPDLRFLFVTKRIERLAQVLPPDWREGYPNVAIFATCENQDRADYRLPILKNLPIGYKGIICEPLLEPVELRPYLGSWVRQVIVGGESGPQARPCDFRWIQSLAAQCRQAGVAFHFKQTGANFVKDGRRYQIPRQLQHSQAQKAGMDFLGEGEIWL